MSTRCLDQRDGRFELSIVAAIVIALCLFLRPLAIERGKLGPMFVDLLGEELPLHANKLWTCARAADETPFRDWQRRSTPRAIARCPVAQQRNRS